MKRALLIVDIQNDYFKGGNMELVHPEAACANAIKIADAFRAKGLPVLYMRHIAQEKDATFFIPGTKGIEIRSEIQPKEGDKVFIKHYPNSFRETGLLPYLKEEGITHLTILGMMTHICIDTTTRAAVDNGFEVELISDACATRDLEYDGKVAKAEDVQTAFMSAINAGFCPVIKTEEFLKKF
ncbi:MAG: cysteine hydrolase [Prevotella sp.]|jgi:nicotinamidase-related amidase|uniref:Cysteine hydrolase n=1 Tax=Segatella cerevisiae TaxID=2053716 RepID=A0ABT1BVS9_9BACT|nr:cysteine hydrolase family protein [Segatella cerevisiae]MCH3994369.1 cysteine hydrolase [Prevotella sp.]MCI1246552.1 cysteine hydrolase [Prevotella sp.]MCO6024527.1 cysteine hydrolase [Segatella cerevisiae]